jgi:hypothetical protein
MKRDASENRSGRSAAWAVVFAAGWLVMASASSGPVRLAADEKSGSNPSGTGEKASSGKTGDQQPDSKQPDAKKPEARREETRRGGVSAERAQAVLAFAREHHPELADLLTRLQMTDTKQFETAIHDLNRDVERLTKLKEKEKASAQYALAVRKWQYDSRIRLIVARMSMTDSPELEAELRAAVAERVALREQELREERTHLKKRIEANEKQLKQFEEDRDTLIDRELSTLRNSAGGARDRLKKQQTAKKGSVKATGKTDTSKAESVGKDQPAQAPPAGADAKSKDAASKGTDKKEAGN